MAKPCRRWLLGLLALCSVCIVDFLTLARARAESISNLFLKMPQDALFWTGSADGKALSQKQRLGILKVRDDKNGYLVLDSSKLEGPGLDRDPVIALFKEKTGQPLLAISSCGDSCSLLFYEPNSHWKDVSKTVWPALDLAKIDSRAQTLVPELKKTQTKISDSASGSVDYRLPRKGTDIEVVCVHEKCPPDTKLFKLKFDGERFFAN